MKAKYLLFASFGFFILIQLLFSLGLAPLSDDLVHYADVVKLRRGELSEMDVFRDLFSDPNRYARPMSPIVLGTMMVLSQYTSFLFFLWGTLFVIPAYLLYKIINKYFGNEWMAVLVSILVLLFPLSSSNHFSPVMQSVQSVVFAFILSCYLSDRKGIYNYLIIGGLSTFSLLLYELNLFVFPILILLIWINNNEKKYLKIFLATILPVILAFLYKKFGVKLFFPEHFDYASTKILLSIDRIKEVPVALFKLFFLDSFYIIGKGIEMIYYYGIWDYGLLIIGAIISIFLAINIKVEKKVSNLKICIVIFVFILSTIVFFVSNYPPVAFGFENRILLWVRFSSILLLGVLISNLLFYAKSKKINYIIKSTVGILVFSFFISVISQKNAWITASKYNENTIKNIVKHFPDSQENIKIIYMLNRGRKAELITDESTISDDYEIAAALKIYSKSNFNPQNIYFANPESYSLYQIGNIKLNKRPKTEYKLTPKGIEIGEKYFTYPFFIYDERDYSIIKVNNQQEFKIK